MTDGRDQTNHADIHNKKEGDTLRPKLLGLPSSKDEVANSANPGKFDFAQLAMSEVNPDPFSPLASRPPNFGRARQFDDLANTAWKNMKASAKSSADIATDDLQNGIQASIQAIRIRLQEVNGTTARTGNSVDKFRVDLGQLRTREGIDKADNYLGDNGPKDWTNDIYRVFDRAYTAIGNNDSKPPIHHNELAKLLVERIAGKPTPPGVQRNTMYTIICENLGTYFPLNKPWTEGTPTDPAELDRKTTLASRLQLTGDAANDFEYLDYLHREYTVSKLWAFTTEKGVPYGVPTNETTLHLSAIKDLGEDLKVMAPKTAPGAPAPQVSWVTTDAENFAKKYRMPVSEAEECRERLTRLELEERRKTYYIHQPQK